MAKEAAEGPTSRRVSVYVAPDDLRRIEVLAELEGKSRSLVMREALSSGLRAKASAETAPEDRGRRKGMTDKQAGRVIAAAEEAGRRAARAEQAALGLMGMLMWFAPSFCDAQNKGNRFVDYFAGRPSSDLFAACERIGAGLREGRTFQSVLRDLPAQAGFDTRAFAGVKRADWEAALDAAMERRKDG